jgi:hypothetical protein
MATSAQREFICMQAGSTRSVTPSPNAHYHDGKYTDTETETETEMETDTYADTDRFTLR